MAVVKGFSGWRYNPQKVPDAADVIVPPYDVISSLELQKMRQQSPYNFTEIILQGSSPDPAQTQSQGVSSRHAKAASILHDWMKNGVLIQDSKPCLYFYEQKFKLTDSELFCQDRKILSGGLSRYGILCRVGLEDYSSRVILPHEKTFSGPKADRYQLMTETQGNMEPVFLGYDSPRFSQDEFKKITLGQKPVCAFTDRSEVEHKLWSLFDPQILDEVGKVLNPLKFYILDGHHRYETALKFFNDHKNVDAQLDHRYVLAAICAFRQPGTVILPTHRALKRANFEIGKGKLSTQWTFESVETLSELEYRLRASLKNAFGLKLKGKGYVFMESKGERNGLDLDLLHDQVLSHFGENLEIDYIKDIQLLEKGVEDSTYELGILVRPSTIEEVMSTAEHNQVMPHKSTFFYPKIPSGLVINIFD